jgi:hypothetical protein
VGVDAVEQVVQVGSGELPVERSGPARQAVFLVGGNKAGNWKRWYDQAIPEAERAYESYLQDMKREGGTGQ